MAGWEDVGCLIRLVDFVIISSGWVFLQAAREVWLVVSLIPVLILIHLTSEVQIQPGWWILYK